MSAETTPNLTENAPLFEKDITMTSEKIEQTILQSAKQVKPKLSQCFFVSSEEVKKIVAEIAYYKAEKRGFQPGYDVQDWVESERDVLKKFVYLGFEKADAR